MMSSTSNRRLSAGEKKLLEEFQLNLERLKQATSKDGRIWKPHAKQRQVLNYIFKKPGTSIFQRPKNVRVFVQAGRKWGKSETAIYTAKRYAALYPNSCVYIIGRTFKQQKEIMWSNKKLQNFANSIPQEISLTECRITYPHNNSFIKVDGSDNFDSQRGMDMDLVILDEFKDQDIRSYEAIYPNLAATNGCLMVIGTPPDVENHYIELRNEAQEDPDWGYFHGTSWDNPHVAKEWLERERAKYFARGDKAIWDREYEAKFIPGGARAVFPTYAKEVHTLPKEVLDEYIQKNFRSLQWYTISDPGTETCFAVLFIAYNPYTGSIYIPKEIYETDRRYTSTVSIWDKVLTAMDELTPGMSREQWVHIYDVHAHWFQNEVWDKYRMNLIPCSKEVNRKEWQISLIKDILSVRGRYYASQECYNHIWEMMNYVTDDSGQYKKLNDHTIDTLRYFLTHVSYTLQGKLSPSELNNTRVERMDRMVSIEEDYRALQEELDPFGFTTSDDWGFDDGIFADF